MQVLRKQGNKTFLKSVRQSAFVNKRNPWMNSVNLLQL